MDKVLSFIIRCLQNTPAETNVHENSYYVKTDSSKHMVDYH